MSKREAALNGLRKLLESGEYPVSTRLLAERKLAERLGFSRSLVRDALAHLEAEGRLWRHVGRGTFVGGRPVKSKRDLAIISSSTSPAEVFEARLAVEPELSRLAALRATPDDIAHLQHCLRKMERAPNYSNYFRWDSTLHRAVAEAAHNTLLLAMFDSVNAAREEVLWAGLFQTSMRATEAPDWLGKSAEQHDAIVEAIRMRNPASAETIARQHIEDVRTYLMQSRRRGDTSMHTELPRGKAVP